jgi:hypothetical protein
MITSVNRFGTLLIMLILASIPCRGIAANQLAGTVYGGSNPLSGATITLLDPATANHLASTTTDTNGGYAFSVNDGVYNLSVSPPAGSGFVDSAVNGIAVSGADVAQNVVLVHDQLFSLSGTVCAWDGATTVGLPYQIFIQDESNESGSPTPYDANASFDLVCTPGEIWANILGGRDLGMDVALGAGQVRLSGAVCAEDGVTPMSMCSIQALSPSTGNSVGSAFSTENGNFQISCPPGEITLEIAASRELGSIHPIPLPEGFSMVLPPFDLEQDTDLTTFTRPISSRSPAKRRIPKVYRLRECP